VIVQTAEGPGAPQFVIRQLDHTGFAGRLAERFGNESFQRLEPWDVYVDLVHHHDQGWDELDQQFLQDPGTGLPFHLVATPLPQLVGTGALSPDFNEARSAFAGVLSSMHTYGLYNGRYGLSDVLFVDRIPADLRPTVDAMLAGELERQERLKGVLRSDAATAHLADDALLLQAYKLLQLFDTLALWCQCEHPFNRVEQRFPNVPVSVDEDVTITVTPIDAVTALVSPFPFDEDGVTCATDGRWLEPQPPGADLASAFERAAPAQQLMTFVAG
jgi:hypothetical protein